MADGTVTEKKKSRKLRSSGKEMKMEGKTIANREPETLKEVPQEVLETVYAGEGKDSSCTCKICGASFKSPAALSCHLATHAGRVR